MGCPTEVVIGDTLVFSVCTHDVNTGELTDADSNPLYRLYEDETSTPILTGNLAKLDNLNTTGFYSESITCSVANGFENGKTYTVYIEAKVDGNTGAISFAFKAVDEATGSLLTMQNIRDAMKLAPTAGSPATGSVDKHLDDIQAKTDLLTAGMISVISPLALDGSLLTIVRGDDYKAVNNRAIEFTSDDWPDITGAAVTLTIRVKQTKVEELSVTGTVVDESTCQFELDHEDTEDMTVSNQGHFFDVEAVLSDGNVCTLALGSCTVREDATYD